MSLLSKASSLEKKGKEIFHFELGEPQISTPSPVIDEINRVLKLNGYLYIAMPNSASFIKRIRFLCLRCWCSFISERF